MCSVKHSHGAVNLCEAACSQKWIAKGDGSRVGGKVVIRVATSTAAAGVGQGEEDGPLESRDLFASVASVPKLVVGRKLPLPVPHKLQRPVPLPRRRPGTGPRRRRLLLGVDGEDMVLTLAASIKDLADERGVAEVLGKYEQCLNKLQLERLIRELGQMQLGRRAVEVSQWVLGLPQLSLDDRTLCGAIQAMVREGEVKTACELAECASLNPGLVSQTLALALVEAGMVGACVETLERMELLGFENYVVPVYSKVIVEASRRGNRILVEKLVEKLLCKDASFQLEDCSAVIAACSKVGLLEAAESFFRVLVGTGVQPNVVVYTALISARARAEKHREAAALIWEMEEAECCLDLMAYRVVVGVLGELQDLPKAARMFNRLKSDGFSPTIDIYNVLVKLYCNQGRFGKAKDVLKEMQMRGCPPNHQTLAHFTSDNTSSNKVEIG